jgi:hypothetical protein
MLWLRVRVRVKQSNLIRTVAGIVHNAVNLVQTHASADTEHRAIPVLVVPANNRQPIFHASTLALYGRLPPGLPSLVVTRHILT